MRGLVIRTNEFIILFSICIVSVLSIFFPFEGVIILFFLCCFWGAKNNYETLLFLVMSMFFQNIVLIIGARAFEGSTTTMYLLAKELIIYGCCFIMMIKYCMKKIYLTKNSILMIMFVVILIFNMLASSADFYARMVSLRQLLLPFVCYYFGMSLNIKTDEIKRISIVIVIFSLILAVVGFVEVFFCPDNFWNSELLLQYNVNKGSQFEFYKGLPMNFHTFDLFILTGDTTRRLVSLLADPLLTAHYIFLGFVLANAYIQTNLRKKIVVSILTLGLFLTISKGVIISFFIFIILRKLSKVPFYKIKRYIYCGMIVTAFMTLVIYDFATKYMSTSSILIHMDGATRGLLDASVLGNGLGNAGTMTGILSQTDDLLTAESYIGTLVAQIGYIGLLFFVTFWFNKIIMSLERWKNRKNQLGFCVMTLLMSVLVECIFSESAIALSATGLYFIYAGILLKNSTTYE